MSTRAVIQIKKTTDYGTGNPNNGEHRIQYYHHWDGYTSYLGINLVKILLDLIAERSPSDFKDVHSVRYYLQDVLNQKYQIEDIVTHGDIEYFYLIDFNNGITLTRFKRNWETDKVDEPEKWNSCILFKASDREKYYKLEIIDYQEKYD